MESEEIKSKRKLLAEALRNGDPGVSMEVVSTNDCVEDESMNAPCFKPRNRGGDWYYVEDSLKRPYIVKFVNRYPNHKRYYERYSGIPVPPEAHNCQFYPNPIEIDENTSDIIFIIIDRYSFFSLDVSAIKRSFAQNNEQEDFVMDNNNVNNDAIAARRRALAEALRQGEPVVVTPTGEVGTKDEMQENGLSGIQVPDGKLAKED